MVVRAKHVSEVSRVPIPALAHFIEESCRVLTEMLGLQAWDIVVRFDEGAITEGSGNWAEVDKNVPNRYAVIGFDVARLSGEQDPYEQAYALVCHEVAHLLLASMDVHQQVIEVWARERSEAERTIEERLWHYAIEVATEQVAALIQVAYPRPISMPLPSDVPLTDEDRGWSRPSWNQDLGTEKGKRHDST